MIPHEWKGRILPMKITVVYGGFSSERDISLLSGKAIYDAMSGYGGNEVTLFDLDRTNIRSLIDERPDVVFLALHGRGGEDGCIQGMLDLCGIPYTGSGVSASALCMNKLLTKKILNSAGLPNADYIEITRDAWNNDRVETIEKTVAALGENVVVKAPCEGSSIGVVIASGRKEISSAIDEVFRYGNKIFAEEYLDGTEVSLPIIGRTCSPEALPVIEILTDSRFYDYNAKYSSGGSRHVIPAAIDENTEKIIVETGKKAYSELGCNGIARIDFIVDKKKGPVIMEVNTLPGMTEMSLVPDAARAAGISFPSLCMKLVDFALTDRKNKNSL